MSKNYILGTDNNGNAFKNSDVAKGILAAAKILDDKLQGLKKGLDTKTNLNPLINELNALPYDGGIKFMVRHCGVLRVCTPAAPGFFAAEIAIPRTLTTAFADTLKSVAKKVRA